MSTTAGQTESTATKTTTGATRTGRCEALDLIRQIRALTQAATKEQIAFWSRVNVGDVDECWEWGGSRRGQMGYASFGSKQGHRFAYEDFYGPVPRGTVIRHTCDNPPCVNPFHLLPGTIADNVRDMHERGRARKFPVNRCRTKLTDEQAMEIKRRWVRGESSTALAAELGLDFTTVSMIGSGRTWKHLPEPERVVGPGLCGCGCGQKTSLAKRTNTKLGHVAGEPVRFVMGHGARRR